MISYSEIDHPILKVQINVPKINHNKASVSIR